MKPAIELPEVVCPTPIDENYRMSDTSQKWKIGDVFTVQTADTRHVLGQVIGREAEILNSVSVAFFDLRFESWRDAANVQDLPLDRLFASLLTTRDLLDSGEWRVVCNRASTIPSSLFPYESLRTSGFVGARIIGSGNVNEFLDAFYGLAAWDDWHDPNYLDGLLISLEKKPANLLYKHQ